MNRPNQHIPVKHNKSTDTDDLINARTIAHIVYALHLLGFYTAILPVAGIILNYIKKDDVRGSWLESHYRWQIRTFWFGIVWSLVALPFLLVPLIQYVVLVILIAWWVYRNLKGWLRLAENKEMYISDSTNTKVQSDSEH